LVETAISFIHTTSALNRTAYCWNDPPTTSYHHSFNNRNWNISVASRTSRLA
jgi:hypothetical protein